MHEDCVCSMSWNTLVHLPTCISVILMAVIRLTGTRDTIGGGGTGHTIHGSGVGTGIGDGIISTAVGTLRIITTHSGDPVIAGVGIVPTTTMVIMVTDHIITIITTHRITQAVTVIRTTGRVTGPITTIGVFIMDNADNQA
jgi:hypothetical protein